MLSNVPSFENGQFFLERPRIHRLLEKAVENFVVLVCAGEGYGKTYAVSSFLKNRAKPAAWMQFSRRDNQPWRFWENYTKAMGNSRAQAGREMRELGFPETARQYNKWLDISRREFSLNTRRAGTEEEAGRFVIVGDDFHCIKSRAVLDFMEQALAFPHLGHTLVLISRGETALNTIPFLAKGRLTRIDAEELLFTPEETAEYFLRQGIEISDGDIEAVHHDTEGWPMAMGMAAVIIKKSGCKYIQPILKDSAFKVFEDDLFTSVPKEIQVFLVKLSLFEQWPIELIGKCAAVLPEKYREISGVLAEIDKLSAFVRYDYYLRGYRIHQIFLEYLREKQKELPVEEKKAVCAIAAGWCLENNLRMDAAINFERADDFAGLAGVVDSFSWIVPPSAAAELLEITGRPAKRGVCAEGNENLQYLQRIVQGRLLMCISRLDEAEALFNENIRQFEQMPPSPAVSRILSESWNYLGFIALFKSRFTNSNAYIGCMEKACFYYQRHPWPIPIYMAIYSVSSYVTQSGFPAAAGALAQRIENFSRSIPVAVNPLNEWFSGIDDLARTELAYFQDNLDEAERFARRTLFKMRGKNQYEIEHRALFFLLRIYLHRGNPENLIEILKQTEALAAVNNYPRFGVINDMVKGWLFAQLGMPEKTVSWLRQTFEAGEMHSIFRNYESIVKAKCLYAEKKFAETAAFLNNKENREGLGTYLLGMIEMNCLEAAARFQLDDKDTALQILEKGYEAAAPNSLDMPFIELGYEMRSLAGIAYNKKTAAGNVSRRIPSAWMEDIRNRASAYGKNLSAIAEYLRNNAGLSISDGVSKAAVYLTRQERIVLNSLSRGQTREETADLNGLSLSSVKILIGRICDKLGAVNRADAVRIALGMGILEK